MTCLSMLDIKLGPEDKMKTNIASSSRIYDLVGSILFSEFLYKTYI